jgi:hypothetical protein
MDYPVHKQNFRVPVWKVPATKSKGMTNNGCGGIKIETKRCTKCGEVKPIEEFTSNKSNGHIYKKSWCKKCVAARAANPYQTDPEYHERYNEYQRRWRQKYRIHQVCVLCGKPLEFYQKKYCLTCIALRTGRRTGRPASCCDILSKHHNDLAKDPEHLTTDFIKKLSRCECEEVQENDR